MIDFYHQKSDRIDQSYGFRVLEIERELYREARRLSPDADLRTLSSALHAGNQTWVGLETETLQTPYHELARLCELLPLCPNQQVVDLGAGYGRLGVVLHELYPQVKFTGHEYVPERVQEGNRIYKLHGISGKLIQTDLMSEDFSLPEADYYFIYDFGRVAHIKHTLEQIADMADRKKLTVIARGKGVRSLIDLEFPWLSQVNNPIHETNFSLYFS